MAAVRAPPGELLEALQNAELCDPGILLAYPRGRLMPPHVSRKRFFGKKQSSSYSADQTYSTAVTATDTGIPGIGLSYLPTPSPLSSSLSSSSLNSVLVVPASSGTAPVHGQKSAQGSEEQLPVHGQTTAERSETQLPQSGHGGPKPSISRTFARISENPKVEEVTRQVDGMGGVGSNSSKLGSGVQPVLSVGTSEPISQHLSVLSLDEQHPQPTGVDFDASLLYKTLVADGALPGGWQSEFVKLVQAARPARDRQLRAFSRVKNEDASA